MSKEIELRTFSKLEQDGKLGWAAVPKSVKKSAVLEELLATGILSKNRRGAGTVLLLRDKESLQAYLNQRFPGRHTTAGGDAFQNQQRYRDSKGAAKTSIGVLLLRGWITIRINDKAVNLAEATQHYGCFSAIKPQLDSPRICVVENLDCFMCAEEVLGKEWVFVHPYGRLSKDSLQGLNDSEVLHFCDLDYTGLDEYLRIKEQFSQTRLYLPNQLEDWWNRQSTPLKKGAVITKRLRQTTDKAVIRVLGLLEKTNCFLEQQAFFLPQNTRR